MPVPEHRYYFETESNDDDYVDEVTGETIKGLVINVWAGITWIIMSLNRFHSYYRNVDAFVKRLKLSF